MEIQHQIVVIDDDEQILRLVEMALRADGHHVITAGTATDGMGYALEADADLVVLDLNLPDGDGIEMARAIRANRNIPILMLTGRVEVAERVEGLDAGADDYLTKPFDVEELRARVRSLLRRIDLSEDKKEAGGGILVHRDWHLDVASRQLVDKGSAPLSLTGREFLILVTLMRRAGNIVTRDELQRHVSGRQWQPDDRSLDVHMASLRKKIKDLSSSAFPIQTVRGRGFVFEGDVAHLSNNGDEGADAGS